MKVSKILLVVALMVPLRGFGQKKNAEFFFHQGELAMEDNKYTMALAHLSECLRLDPYYWDAYPARASAKERLGDSRGALTDFNIYIDSRPDDLHALLGRAILRYELGQYLPAREDFLAVLKSPPEMTSKVLFRQTSEGTDKMFTIQGSKHTDFFNYLGLIETRLKNYGQASIYLDSAIKLSPDDPQTYINRGKLKEHLLDTLAAINDYQKALSIDPSNSQAKHNLAAINRLKDSVNETEKLLDEAITQSPSLPAPYAARAFYRFQHHQYKAAIEDYDKALQLNKSDEESWLYRGMVKEKIKDFDGAFVDYTESINVNNENSKAWMARGTLLTKLNRIPEAIEDYTVAILWYPDFGLAYYNRGIAYQKTGKPTEACMDLKKAQILNVKVEIALLAKVCR